MIVPVDLDFDLAADDECVVLVSVKIPPAALPEVMTAIGETDLWRVKLALFKRTQSGVLPEGVNGLGVVHEAQWDIALEFTSPALAQAFLQRMKGGD